MWRKGLIRIKSDHIGKYCERFRREIIRPVCSVRNTWEGITKQHLEHPDLGMIVEGLWAFLAQL